MQPRGPQTLALGALPRAVSLDLGRTIARCRLQAPGSDPGPALLLPPVAWEGASQLLQQPGLTAERSAPLISPDAGFVLGAQL